MARSKSLHFVHKTFTIVQPDGGENNVLDEQVDLALELSNVLGRNIRQGQTFRVVGAQGHLHGVTGDQDVGFSVGIEAFYIPTTSHSRKAWNNVFKQWKAQKNLAGKVGSQIRYDDLEYAWSTDYKTSRTSSIHGQGIGDANTEDLCLLGASTGGDDFCLQDYYNSSFPAPTQSVDHFTNVSIKTPKMGTTRFPATQAIRFSATSSAMVDSQNDPDYLGNGINMSDFQFFPADNHVNVFCGLFKLNGYVMPPDTIGQIADTLSLTVTFAIEGWHPLVYKRIPAPHTSRPRRTKWKRSFKPRRSKRKYRRR